MATPTTFTVRNVDAAQLTTGNTTLLTVANNTNGIKLTSIILVNTTSTPTAATLYLVPSGGSAAASNMVCRDFSVPADGLPYEIAPTHGEVFLEANALVQGSAGAASALTYHISYIEFD